jgi:hypothetical protein
MTNATSQMMVIELFHGTVRCLGRFLAVVHSPLPSLNRLPFLLKIQSGQVANFKTHSLVFSGSPLPSFGILPRNVTDHSH